MLALAAVIAAATTPACSSDQLRLVYEGSQGGLGTMFEALRLVPRAGVSCGMRGYPGVSVLGRHRHRLPVHFGREHGSANPVRTRTYSAAHPARFDVRHPSADPKTTRPCRMRAYYFRVIPPNETQPLTVRTKAKLFCRTNARVTPVGSHY